MNRKVQHLLTASASVLAIGAGAVAAHAATKPGATISIAGGVNGVWQDSYALTDIDTATVKPATDETGVVESQLITTGVSATLNSQATGRIEYVGSVSGIADIAITNPKGGSFAFKASATNDVSGVSATGVNAQADATVRRALDEHFTANGKMTATVDNAGTLAVSSEAIAKVKPTNVAATATANSLVNNGIRQRVTSTTNDATVKLANSGTLTVGSVAKADGAASGVASATLNNGIHQVAITNGSPSVSTSGSTSSTTYTPVASVALTNAAGATINLTADAQATAANSTTNTASAAADVSQAIHQRAIVANGIGKTSLVNDGTLNITANALAKASAPAASASVSGATTAAVAPPSQVSATATANAYNVGAITQGQLPFGDGEDAGGEDAIGGVLSFLGNLVDPEPTVSQSGSAGAQTAALPAGVVGQSQVFTNNSAATFGGNAVATGVASAAANAGVLGIVQATAANNVALTLTNSSTGTINVPVVATATGTGLGSAATASGVGIGSIQIADATAGGLPTNGIANIDYTNAGTVKVDVKSTGTADASADSLAVAVGHIQVAGGDNSAGAVNFTNSKDFTVSAAAKANTTDTTVVDSDALAFAIGYVGVADNQTIKATNSGNFTVAASAEAEKQTNAQAIGMLVGGNDTLAAPSTTTVFSTPVNVVNSGNLTVTATAKDTNATASAPTNTTDNVARAGGIILTGTVNNAVVTNSGTITTTAIASPGGLAQAYGISFLGNTTPNPAALPGDKITINNNAGTIISRVSTDNGATYKWGKAIDTWGATAPVNVNLNGGANGAVGKIYGIVDITADDTITVANGETQLNGLVNKAGELEGKLIIAKGGTLYLQDRPEDKFGTVAGDNYNGPSKVYVDSFTNAGGGVLAIETPVHNTTGEVPYASYPQVFTNSADITGGVLEIRPSSGVNDSGLYDDSYVLNDVIVSTTPIKGDLAAVNTRSVLLTGAAHKDKLNGPTQVAGANDTLDVQITRVAFDAVAGLDRNETSVASAIEGTYDPTLSTAPGSYGSVLADLFKFDDATQYAGALEQLAATQYAGYLRSSTMAGARFNGLIYDMAECGKGSITNELCRSENGGPRLWVTGNYGRVSTDGDHEAAGFKAVQYWIAAGLDFAVTPNFVLGVAGGYLENNNKFKANEYDYKGGDSIKSKGWQAGIYGNYDSGKFYVKGAISYSDLDGNARRNIDFGTAGSTYVGAPKTVTAGLITGDADVNVWAAGAEAGVRFPLGENATITPYASLDYAHAKMGRFTEKTSDLSAQGALLSVRGSDEFFASELGLELAAQWGNVSPYIRGGWQHNFGDKRAKFTGDFIGAPAGTEFDVISERFSPDAGVLEVGLAAQFSPNFNAHLGYQGRFSSNLTEHTGGLTLSYLFGGSEPAAPPPPPAPTAPPPPPPAPPQVVCNKGPYIVFFDWDKSDITPEAATVLDSAVTAYGNCDVVPIMLAGYTDRSGSDRYNQGLSARRNTSVQGYLTGRGIPADRISSQAFGETNNRVPTADGVRELQNRRVEITYGPGSGN